MAPLRSQPLKGCLVSMLELDISLLVEHCLTDPMTIDVYTAREKTVPSFLPQLPNDFV
jgi:hypothetical protein